MTIREIEELSGMTRANIRFYEKEKLITPQRNSNGYRNYSEEDLNVLKRIRLLRVLQLSLEDIKSLSRNEQDLSRLLLRHLRTLNKEQKTLEYSVKICEQLYKDGAAYDSFDAQHYLNLMDSSSLELPSELKEDTIPKVTSPWARYLARSLDAGIYILLWSIFLSLVFHINIAERGFAGNIVDIIALNCIFLLAEPLMLSGFGTTPGKFLFGLRVTSETGARLTRGEAFHRTWTVLKTGCGFNLPVYWIIRMYKSYRACKNGETLDWEQETLLWKNDRYILLRATVSIISLVLINTLASLLVWQAGALPQNKGNITVEQYAELPQLDYTVENGIMTGLSFSASYENEDRTIASYSDLMAVSALAFLCAQDDYHMLPAPPSFIYAQIKANGDNFSGFTISEAGVTIRCTIEYEGYDLRPDVWSQSRVLVPSYGGEPSFHISFSVQRAD